MKKSLLFLCFFISFYDLISQNGDVGYGGRFTPPSLLYESIVFQRNDTVFGMRIYPSKTGIDSVCYTGFATKLRKSRWIIDKNEDSSYSIVKYVKIKPSTWYQENNGKLFRADFQCMVRKQWTCFPDGSTFVYWRFGSISHSKKSAAKKGKCSECK